MDTIKINSQNTKMVAHRGVSGIELENTNASFIAAGNRSYYGIETDVHKTADGRFVVHHDDKTGRLCHTDVTVEETTFEVLRSLRLNDKEGDPDRADLLNGYEFARAQLFDLIDRTQTENQARAVREANSESNEQRKAA